MEENTNLRITSRIIGKDKNIALLTMDGYVDTTTAPLLKKELLSFAENVCRYIINFRGVDYVSSAGWGVILGRIKENREKGGDIVFVTMNKDVYSIYELLGLRKVIQYFSKIEEGINYYGYSVAETLKKEEDEESIPEPEITRAGAKIEEVIFSIVQDDPLLNIHQIKKSLGEPRHGLKNIGICKLYFLLRKLGLNTREKRLYYAWQQVKKTTER
jgi:anti-sigma B factor antagonist